LGTDSAQDVIVVRQVGFAVLATVDARRVEVDVVGESHDGLCEESKGRRFAISTELVKRRQVAAAYRIAARRSRSREAGPWGE